MSEQLSRRCLMRTGLTGAAGFAASAAMPAIAAQSPFSSEYWECYRRFIELERERSAPEADEDGWEPSAPVLKAQNACHEAQEALLRRPVETLIDVVALLRVDHWQSGHFVRPKSWLFIERERERALRGIEKLAGVAPWDVPDWLVRCVADADAREAARRAKWEAYCESRRGVLREDFF